jgi:hypothetical protein
VKECLTTDGIASISHVSVDKVRDAFAEMLKACNRQRIAAEVADAALAGHGKAIVYALHIHDEAKMRFRSYDRVKDAAFGEYSDKPVFSRGRYSKVQNNAVCVCVPFH